MPLMLLLSLLLPCIVTGAPDPESFRVRHVPDLPHQPNFNTYAGFIPIMDQWTKEPKNMFFWFVNAEDRPEEKPVVIWLNGGPGCSSLLGMFTEQGPFHFDEHDGSKLHFNPYAWNKVVNILFLEQPSGVGYSYGGNYTTGDRVAQVDNYLFLVKFFEIFTAYKYVPFWVAGESFAGNYVPELAYEIFMQNKNVPESQYIPLAGWVMGNPTGVMSYDFDDGMFPFLQAHGILSKAELAIIKAACAKGYKECRATWQQYYTSNFKGINPYNIYATCVGAGPGNNPSCLTNSDFDSIAPGDSQTFVPCLDLNNSINYLNREDVKRHLHAEATTQKWLPCSPYIHYDEFEPVPPKVKAMVGHMRIVIYSGDVDSCVPWTVTDAGVRQLGYNQTSPTRQWLYKDDRMSRQWPQVGGFVWEYEKNLTYITVKGAGHMVPSHLMGKPAAALAFFERVIRGQPI